MKWLDWLNFTKKKTPDDNGDVSNFAENGLEQLHQASDGKTGGIGDWAQSVLNPNAAKGSAFGPAGTAMGAGLDVLGAGFNEVQSENDKAVAEKQAQEKELQDRMDTGALLNYKKGEAHQGKQFAGLDYLSSEADKAMANSKKKSYRDVLANALGF
jgi:hypothetical protein